MAFDEVPSAPKKSRETSHIATDAALEALRRRGEEGV